MAINLTDKYEKQVAERWFKKSFTAAMSGNEYTFDGVKSIKVFSIDVAPLQNYSKSVNGFNGSRYGTPKDLTDTLVEYTMKGDKSFTYIIDRGDEVNQFNIKKANRSLQRQLDEVVHPYMDRYNLATWNKKGEGRVAVDMTSGSTAWEGLIDAQQKMDNALVPESGRCLTVGTQLYKKLLLNDQFVYTDKLANEKFIKGQIGELAGLPVIKIPDSYLPKGVLGMITQKAALLAPNKLADYKIHTDPPGINGDLVEGRFMHDAFVISSKRKCVISLYDKTNGAGNVMKGYVSFKANSTTHIECNDAIDTFSGTGNAVYHYTVDGSDPKLSKKAYTCSTVYIPITDLQNAVNDSTPGLNENIMFRFYVSGDKDNSETIAWKAFKPSNVQAVTQAEWLAALTKDNVIDIDSIGYSDPSADI